MSAITATTNRKVKWIRKLQSQRSARHEQGHFVIEGTRLLKEALSAGARVPLVLYSDPPDDDTLKLVDGFAAYGSETLSASNEVIQSCSDTEAPQGVLAVVKLEAKPAPTLSEPVLIVDRVRDPGNLGSLMRSAFAARMALVLLTPGTVDALNPKVVRGAMGAHFYLSFQQVEYDDLDPYLRDKTLWIAEANRGIRYDLPDWSQPCALLIGSEAHGPSSEILTHDHQHVHIPINPEAESLNAAVAGSILMFEIARQRGFE